MLRYEGRQKAKVILWGRFKTEGELFVLRFGFLFGCLGLCPGLAGTLGLVDNSKLELHDDLSNLVRGTKLVFFFFLLLKGWLLTRRHGTMMFWEGNRSEGPAKDEAEYMVIVGSVLFDAMLTSVKNQHALLGFSPET